ncbi:hypothetical protein ACFLV1_03080, partial [Chloroflexota bacterium]
MVMPTESTPELRDEKEEGGSFKKYTGPMAIVTKAVAAATVLFCLLYVSGVLPTFGIYFHRIQFNAIFMSGVLILLFMIYPLRRRRLSNRLPWYDILFIVAALFPTSYIIINALEIGDYAAVFASPFETALGIVMILILLEAVRRVTGWPVVIIASLFLLYAKASYLMPGILSSADQPWPRIMMQVYMTRDGMFGTTTSLAS